MYNRPNDLTRMQIEKLAIRNAILEGNIIRLRRLLENRMTNHRSLYFFAVDTSNVDIIQSFLDNGYDVDTKDCNGDTALHISCTNFNPDLVDLMLNYGSDASAINMHSSNPLDLLALNFSGVCLSLRIIHGGRISEEHIPQYKRIQEAVLRILVLFFEHGVVLDARNNSHRAMLNLILPDATKQYIELLTKWNFDFEYMQILGGRTMLHCVTESGNVEVAEELLPYVNIDSISGMGTPLHAAAFFGQYECAKLLIKNGCNVDIENGRNETALYTAFVSRAAESDLVFERLIRFRSGVNSVVLKNVALWEFISHLTETKITAVKSEKLLSLARHLLKMRLAMFSGIDWILPLFLESKEFQQKWEGYEFVNECSREIEVLKETQVCADLRLYDLLTKHENHTAWYVNNDVTKKFETNFYKSMFPLYSDSLYVAYNCASERRKLLNKCEHIYSDIFSSLNVPYPAIRNILKYLDNNDLECIVRN